MEKLDHLIPTDTDKFKVEEVSNNVFKIKIKETSLTVKLLPSDLANENEKVKIELIRIPEYYDTNFKKLLGYVYYVLVPNFKIKDA